MIVDREIWYYGSVLVLYTPNALFNVYRNSGKIHLSKFSIQNKKFLSLKFYG